MRLLPKTVFIFCSMQFLACANAQNVSERLKDYGRYMTVKEFEDLLNRKEVELVEDLSKIDSDCRISYPCTDLTGEGEIFSHDYLPEKEFQEGGCFYGVDFPKPTTWRILRDRLNYHEDVFVVEAAYDTMIFLKIDGEYDLWISSGGGLRVRILPGMELSEPVGSPNEDSAVAPSS